jgi:hypothetical protein
MSVAHCERQTYDTHQRYIRNVIAYASAGGGGDPQARPKTLEGSELILAALHDMRDPELATAERDHGRLSTRDHCNADAGSIELLQTITIADVEDLQLLAPGAEVQAAIGQHAIDIQHEQLNGCSRAHPRQ